MTELSARRGRVVVVDDHLLVAHVVVIALTNHGFDATSVDLDEHVSLVTLLPRILDDPPDVLLLDLDLGSYGDGRAVIGPAVHAGVEVVVMTGGHEEAVRAIEAGARWTIPKTAPLEDLLGMLESLLPGGPLLPATA